MASDEARVPKQAIEPIPFGRYALLDRLNVGGMAEVFLAKSIGVHDVERFVAIKRILPQVADDPEFERMFIDEAKLSVQLTHANVAQTFELGRIGPSLYIAMEYVSGVDLRQIWEHMQHGGEMPIAAIVYIVGKLCEGLDYAHRKVDEAGRALGIVHRDISPQNIMVAYDGRVKVIDFGIAKAKIRASQTRVGILKGKFAYMSPEQVGGVELDARSDVFSVGIVLYELLTKARLFKSESDFMTLERARHVELYPPRLVNPLIPRELERIVMKTLARDREDRTESAEALQEMLTRFAVQSGESCGARDLSALLQREFSEGYDEERARLVAYREVHIAPAAQEVELTAAHTPEGVDRLAQLVAAQGAQVASGETRIMGAAEEDDEGLEKTVVSHTPPAGAWPMAPELSDTPNIREGQSDRIRISREPTRLLQEAPSDELKTERVTRPSRAKPSRNVLVAKERPRKKQRPPKRIAREPSNATRSAARLVEPRFGRESVIVWFSTALAIVVVLVAYWLAGVLNPSAQIVIDAEPKSAELVVNTKRLGLIDEHGPFEVAPGDVLVEVRAPGYCPWFRNLKLSGKESFSTRVVLQPRTSSLCPL